VLADQMSGSRAHAGFVERIPDPADASGGERRNESAKVRIAGTRGIDDCDRYAGHVNHC